MSIEKVTARTAPDLIAGRSSQQPEGQGDAPAEQLEFLSLSIEDDAGGDPYNRTGQHCLADLKKRAR
jgi:hypothetical protein